jgi:Flp pilus assembly pilin Flp|tara:strand:+ start:2119 stop:2646 length:528 start_codon:yes stop_codon:yes gene_type:complete
MTDMTKFIPGFFRPDGRARHGVDPRKRSALGRLVRENRGVAAVEMALITPILMLMLLGVIDFGMAINHKMSLVDAARAGAQVALLRKPVNGDFNFVRTAVLGTFPNDGATRTINITETCRCDDDTGVACNGTCQAPGPIKKFISVSVQEDYTTLFSYPLVPNPIHLDETATLRIN